LEVISRDFYRLDDGNVEELLKSNHLDYEVKSSRGKARES
jgi:hypothetical protein